MKTKSIVIDDGLLGRFWAKVDKLGDGGCWTWTASTDTCGYGSIGLSNQRLCVRAHRVSWVIENGEIPNGKYVLHRCDNPACVNPDHLFLGDQKDNMKDMIEKGRGYDRLGSGNPNNILSEDDVVDICKLLSDDEYSAVEVAEMFFVSQHVVSQINTGKNWSWLTGASSNKPIRKIKHNKLTEIDVRFIRHWLKSGYKNNELAKEFRVSPTTIHEIKIGRTWAHV